MANGAGDVTKQVTDAFESVMDELTARLREEPKRLDLAVRCAVLRAVVAGLKIGTAEVSAQVIEKGGELVNVQLDANYDELDAAADQMWLDRA